MSSVYRSKINQVLMMRHRGFQPNQAFRNAGDATNFKFEPINEEALLANEQTFNAHYKGEDTNLITFYVSQKEIKGVISTEITILYWINIDDPVGTIYTVNIIELYESLKKAFPALKIPNIIVVSKSPMNPKVSKDLRQDMGTYIQVLNYQQLLPLNHAQEIKMRPATIEELKNFPQVHNPRLLPTLYVDDRTVLYNGWFPGTIIRCDRISPKFVSTGERTIMWRLVTNELMPKVKAK